MWSESISKKFPKTQKHYERLSHSEDDSHKRMCDNAQKMLDLDVLEGDLPELMSENDLLKFFGERVEYDIIRRDLCSKSLINNDGSIIRPFFKRCYSILGQVDDEDYPCVDAKDAENYNSYISPGDERDSYKVEESIRLAHLPDVSVMMSKLSKFGWLDSRSERLKMIYENKLLNSAPTVIIRPLSFLSIHRERIELERMCLTFSSCFEPADTGRAAIRKVLPCQLTNSSMFTEHVSHVHKINDFIMHELRYIKTKIMNEGEKSFSFYVEREVWLRLPVILSAYYLLEEVRCNAYKLLPSYKTQDKLKLYDINILDLFDAVHRERVTNACVRPQFIVYLMTIIYLVDDNKLKFYFSSRQKLMALNMTCKISYCRKISPALAERYSDILKVYFSLSKIMLGISEDSLRLNESSLLSSKHTDAGFSHDMCTVMQYNDEMNFLSVNSPEVCSSKVVIQGILLRDSPIVGFTSRAKWGLYNMLYDALEARAFCGYKDNFDSRRVKCEPNCCKKCRADYLLKADEISESLRSRNKDSSLSSVYLYVNECYEQINQKNHKQPLEHMNTYAAWVEQKENLTAQLISSCLQLEGIKLDLIVKHGYLEENFPGVRFERRAVDEPKMPVYYEDTLFPRYFARREKNYSPSKITAVFYERSSKNHTLLAYFAPNGVPKISYSNLLREENCDCVECMTRDSILKVYHDVKKIHEDKDDDRLGLTSLGKQILRASLESLDVWDKNDDLFMLQAMIAKSDKKLLSFIRDSNANMDAIRTSPCILMHLWVRLREIRELGKSPETRYPCCYRLNDDTLQRFQRQGKRNANGYIEKTMAEKGEASNTFQSVLADKKERIERMIRDREPISQEDMSAWELIISLSEALPDERKVNVLTDEGEEIRLDLSNLKIVDSSHIQQDYLDYCEKMMDLESGYDSDDAKHREYDSEDDFDDQDDYESGDDTFY